MTKRDTRECGRVWERTLILPNELPCWEFESQRTLESSENDCKGQNPSFWWNLYIIGKILKRGCLKWARTTHLESETQVMVKRKVESQTGNLTLDHRKSGIDPISLRTGGMQHAIRKLLTRATTSLQTLSRSEVCTWSYSLAKSREFHPW
jgi:hypothetical protein